MLRAVEKASQLQIVTVGKQPVAGANSYSRDQRPPGLLAAAAVQCVHCSQGTVFSQSDSLPTCSKQQQFGTRN